MVRNVEYGVHEITEITEEATQRQKANGQVEVGIEEVVSRKRSLLIYGPSPRLGGHRCKARDSVYFV